MQGSVIYAYFMLKSFHSWSVLDAVKFVRFVVEWRELKYMLIVFINV